MNPGVGAGGVAGSHVRNGPALVVGRTLLKLQGRGVPRGHPWSTVKLIVPVAEATNDWTPNGRADLQGSARPGFVRAAGRSGPDPTWDTRWPGRSLRLRTGPARSGRRPRRRQRSRMRRLPEKCTTSISKLEASSAYLHVVRVVLNPKRIR